MPTCTSNNKSIVIDIRGKYKTNINSWQAQSNLKNGLALRYRKAMIKLYKFTASVARKISFQ